MDCGRFEASGRPVGTVLVDCFQADPQVRISLACEARQLCRKGSAQQILQHIAKSQRIRTRIQAHKALAAEYLFAALNGGKGEHADEVDLLDGIATFEDTVGSSWDYLDAEFEGNADDDIRRNIYGDDVPAYRIPVILPSTVRPPLAQQERLDDLVQKELDLREGQAEDLLAELRVLLGWKAVSFHQGLRPAKGYVQRTRAWDEIRGITASVQSRARLYAAARTAMLHLAPENTARGAAVRTRFLPLSRQDLRISTELLSSDVQGNRNVPASWIWGRNVAGGDQETPWLEECACPQSCPHRMIAHPFASGRSTCSLAKGARTKRTVA